MSNEGWKPAQQQKGAEEKSGINERHFLGHELSGILRHMAGCVERPVKSEELPYLTFFYRWGEDLANIFNEYERLLSFMKAKEDEIASMRGESETLRKDLEAVRSKNKPLQKHCNDQAEKITRLMAENDGLKKEVEFLIARDNEAGEVFQEILSYKGRSIKTIKDKVKGHLDNGKGKEKSRKQSGK